MEASAKNDAEAMRAVNVMVMGSVCWHLHIDGGDGAPQFQWEQESGLTGQTLRRSPQTH